MCLNYLLQGELEHRNPKGNYKRTSKKEFKQQLAKIERRKARIKHIRQKMASTSALDFADASQPDHDVHHDSSVANDPTQRYHIGINQNQPQEIGKFLRTYSDDPAIKVR